MSGNDVISGSVIISGSAFISGNDVIGGSDVFSGDALSGDLALAACSHYLYRRRRFGASGMSCLGKMVSSSRCARLETAR
nr:hypothetical protein BaRGS_019474 [Batillaria attramentaria]